MKGVDLMPLLKRNLTPLWSVTLANRLPAGTLLLMFLFVRIVLLLNHKKLEYCENSIIAVNHFLACLFQAQFRQMMIDPVVAYCLIEYRRLVLHLVLSASVKP